MRDRTFRCFAALEQHLPASGATSTWRKSRPRLPAATTTGAMADWRGAAPRLAAWYDTAAERPSMKETFPAETPQS